MYCQFDEELLVQHKKMSAKSINLNLSVAVEVVLKVYFGVSSIIFTVFSRCFMVYSLSNWSETTFSPKQAKKKLQQLFKYISMETEGLKNRKVERVIKT